MVDDKMAEILEELKHQEAEVRELALDKLGELKPDNAFDLIVPFLSDSDPEVRGTAAYNLGVIGDDQGIPYLLEIVASDPSEAVRSEALLSLAEYRDPRILDCLLHEVDRKKRSRRPRQEVAKQLRFYDTEESVKALVTLLHDDDVYVRIPAADSLFELNRMDLRDVWLEALADPSEYVFQVATNALAELENIQK